MRTPSIRPLLVSLALGALPAAALAAPVFPGASGVGLEPPPGMTAAKAFDGFQAGPASIVITELPKQAYPRINESRAMFATRFGAKQADDVDIGGAHGFMVVGQQTAGPALYRKWIVVLDGKEETAVVSAQVPVGETALSDAQISAALHTIAFRPRPGLDQQVAALPFSVKDLAGFRISGAALGAALILVDGPKDAEQTPSQAQIIVAANPAAPQGKVPAAFAQAQLRSFQAVRTTDIQSTKLFDAEGAQWVEVEAKGNEGAAGTPVAITYFVRFGMDHSYSILCIAPQAGAARYADRFKTVALSVTPKA